MFKEEAKNEEMLYGAYNKLKSYYHYNKNLLFLKKKIAEFEENDEKMQASIKNLAQILVDPLKHDRQIQKWIDSIDYYVLPKAFVSSSNTESIFVTGITQVDEPVNKVNFFIDMPIELHLLDTLWTLLLGKIVFDQKLLANGCYGNCLDNYVIYNKSEDFFESINFDKNKLFKIYFNQYCSWKNNAIDAVKVNNKQKKNTALVSLDVKSFYYSVHWKFKDIGKYINEDTRLGNITTLTNIISLIFVKYTSVLGDVRELTQRIEKEECVLPIGMFSSMLLANLYLAKYDREVYSQNNVLYYGRYVDDLLILLDTEDYCLKGEREEFNSLLIQKNAILEKANGEEYFLKGEETLKIQRDKVKIIFFEKNKSAGLIRNLEHTRVIPSQMNVVPETELKLEDFEEAAYIIKNFSQESKLRDISRLEIDRFKLGWHMSQLVRSSKYRSINLTTEEKKSRQEEGRKIVEFFRGSNALNYSSNWINALYYFMLTERTSLRVWNNFKSNIKEAIRTLKIERIDAIKSGRNQRVKARLKKDLTDMLDISIATVLALNPEYSKKESTEVLKLALMLRHANLFNHYLVSFPLINYFDEIPDTVDLTDARIESMSELTSEISTSRKCKFSPRFINFDELFHLVYMQNITRGTNYFVDGKQHLANDKINNIISFFYRVNHIQVPSDKNFEIELQNEEKYEGYIVQRVNLGENAIRNIKVAIANVKLDIDRCCLGLPHSKVPILNRKDFIDFLRKSYEENVHFLLLPEFYLPIQWISDVLAFVRRSGITVITGLQYVVADGIAHNNVVVFPAIKSGKYRNYTSSCMFIREKNDYAPMEREILALKGLNCYDQVKPYYQVFQQNGIKYGLFLCYEFTDIVARALYKNEIDMLFAPENNKDTGYFSNIIESTARDLHAFVIQANTSNYGDSRITGPYGKDHRNIVQVKGGDSDNLIIGTLDILGVRRYQKEEKTKQEELLKQYFGMKPHQKYEAEQKYNDKEPKICRTSARFRLHE